MAYNNNAYDLERFAPRAPKESPKKAIIKKFPEQKTQTSPVKNIVLNVIVAVAVVLMICFNIYLRTAINDTNKAIAKADQEIETLMNEQTKLNVKFEQIVSYSTLEEEATALGMQKCSKSQIHYIDTSSDDYSEIIEN